MQELKLNRKIRILLENNIQTLFVFIGKKTNSDYYLLLEINDVNVNVEGNSVIETLENLEKLKEKSELKEYVSMPMDWLEEKWWVGDDDDLNLSIFNLIDYKLNENFTKLIDKNNVEK